MHCFSADFRVVRDMDVFVKCDNLNLLSLNSVNKFNCISLYVIFSWLRNKFISSYMLLITFRYSAFNYVIFSSLSFEVFY